MTTSENPETNNVDNQEINRLTKYFNMPFYISPKGLTLYYCGIIFFEDNRPVIELYKTNTVSYKPIEGILHSFSFSKNVLDKIVKYCYENRKDINERNVKKQIYPAIVIIFKSKSIGVNMNEYDEYIIYIYSTNIIDNVSKQNLHVFYISGQYQTTKKNTRYKHGYVLLIVPYDLYEKFKKLLQVDKNISIKIQNRVKNSTSYIKISYVSSSWLLSRDMKTYPLVISMPFDINFELYDILYSTDKINIKISSTSIKEKQVGSIVNYRLSSYIYRQLPFIAFNSAYISNNKSSPTNILIDPGVLLFEIRVKEEFLNKIRSSIANYVIDAIEKTELNRFIKLNGYDNVKELRNKLNILFGPVFERQIDPKAIMKSLLYGTDHLKSLTILIGRPTEKIKIKNRILREFTRNYIKCFDIELPEYLPEEFREIKYIYLCFTRVRKFEDELYEILKKSKEYQLDGLNKPSSLIAAYLSTLIKRINKFINPSNNDKIIKLDLSRFVDSLALKLIELGTHGLAHLLRKIVASYFNLRERDLGYFLILKSSLYDSVYNNDILVDGYILRHILKTENDSLIPLIVTIGIYLRKHHSYYYLKSHFLSPKEQKVEFINYLKNKISSIISIHDLDQCYTKFLDKAPIAKASLNIALSSSKSSVDPELIEKLVSQYIDTYGRDISAINENIEESIYIPLSELRRLIVKIVNEYNEKEQNINKIDLEELRTYMPALLEYLTPQCFDGCYGCVLSRDCNSRSPLIKEWIVSKYMTKLLCEYFMEESFSK